MPGHWKLRHTPILFVANSLVMLFTFCLFSCFRYSAGLYRSFGFMDGRPALVSFVLFTFITPPLDEVGGWLGGCGVVWAVVLR